MIRRAEERDMGGVLDLAETRRREYGRHQPRMWRESKGARQAQEAYFRRLLEDSETLFLVAEEDMSIAGFLIGELKDAPPVYDPGGKTLLIDDFVVSHPDRWLTTGRVLLQDAWKLAREAGASQTLAVAGHHDVRKQELFGSMGFEVASQWWVGPDEAGSTDLQ